MNFTEGSHERVFTRRTLQGEKETDNKLITILAQAKDFQQGFHFKLCFPSSCHSEKRRIEFLL